LYLRITVQFGAVEDRWGPSRSVFDSFYGLYYTSGRKCNRNSFSSFEEVNYTRQMTWNLFMCTVWRHMRERSYGCTYALIWF